WICKSLAALASPLATAACVETASFIEATPVEPDHAFPRAYFAAIWFDLGEAYDILAVRRSALLSERSAHRNAALRMYRRSSEIWNDLAARKLVSPTDTFRVTAAARAVQRAEAALGRDVAP